MNPIVVRHKPIAVQEVYPYFAIIDNLVIRFALESSLNDDGIFQKTRIHYKHTNILHIKKELVNIIKIGLVNILKRNISTASQDAYINDLYSKYDIVECQDRNEYYTKIINRLNIDIKNDLDIKVDVDKLRLLI